MSLCDTAGRSAIPHRNLSDEINRGIVQSEIEGGVFLADLPAGATLEVETENHKYNLVNAGGGRAWISGHPDYCPDPIEVTVLGSNWGGSIVKSCFIGRGMRLEFSHPRHDMVMTSRIRDIRQLS
jgi:hypothetical protein